MPGPEDEIRSGFDDEGALNLLRTREAAAAARNQALEQRLQQRLAELVRKKERLEEEKYRQLIASEVEALGCNCGKRYYLVDAPLDGTHLSDCPAGIAVAIRTR